jgi:LAS superfamily LD-carboxypeptidase LdcB
MSAGRRRRRRLRRTVFVATLVTALGAGATGYAVWAGPDEAASATAAAHGPASPTDQRPTPRSTQSASPSRAAKTSKTSKTSGNPSGTTRFAPVVTDRIPTPTTSVALSAPVPGTTNMQVPAAAAFERAFADARARGLSPEIRSAWRSEQYQQVLFDRAVARYGSAIEAAKWVLAPERSAHVKGYAVDVHPQAVATWLQTHGAAYGICRTYDNEWWHFEYLATATCPPRQPTAAG